MALQAFGFDLTDASNITDLELYFSIPSIFILATIQPIGEEIFFRGFLLDKISILSDEKTAIIITSVLFGIAHLTYAKVYPAVLTAIVGVLFAFIVVKTKNLFSSIVAHITFNVASITFYILGQMFFNMESLML